MLFHYYDIQNDLCFSDYEILMRMGKNKSLTTVERARITKRVSKGASSAVIAKELIRDLRIIKKAIRNINFTRKVQKNCGRSKLSPRYEENSIGC